MDGLDVNIDTNSEAYKLIRAGIQEALGMSTLSDEELEVFISTNFSIQYTLPKYA